MKILLPFLLLLLTAPGVGAETFLQKCPCGPDSFPGPLRFLLPQGHKGADFRPWCRKHDDCYDTPGSIQKVCDDRFLEDLLAECEHSWRPGGCRRKVRIFHWLVSRFGRRPFLSAQRIAAEKAGFGK